MKRALSIALTTMIALVAACASMRPDGLDESKLPDAIRPDYELFSQRCSKCHALSRALDSGIEDDEYWRLYVEKMRRQPSSGIEPSDEPSILRFLHYYSVERRRQRAEKERERDEAPAIPSSLAPPPSAFFAPSSPAPSAPSPSASGGP